MTIQYVGDGGGSGTIVGSASTHKLGFFGKTPIARPATATAVSSTAITAAASTAATSTTPFGFVTSTQANAIVTAVNELITRNDAALTAANTTTANLEALGLQA